MKLKISHKIFAALFLTSLFTVLITAGISKHFAEKGFMEMIHQKEDEVLSKLAIKLADFYEDNSGWEKLKDKNSWVEILFSSVDRMHEPPSFQNKDFGHLTLKDIMQHEIDKQSGDLKKENKLPRRPPMIFEAAPRLSLYSAEGGHIAGSKSDNKDYTTKTISLYGKKIGELRLGAHNKPNFAEDRQHLNKMVKSLYGSVAVMILISLGSALLLSRKILSPIKELAEATKKLSNRDFDIELNTGTKDELSSLAEDFSDMAKKLKQHEKNQKQWIEDISHELRTPLSVIIGVVSAMIDKVRQPDEKNLNIIYNESERLKKLINDLHELTVAEASFFKINMENVNVSKLLDNILYNYSLKLEQNDVHCFKHFKDKSAIVHADSARLQQVFTNIIENVIKHTEKPVDFHVSLTVVQDKVYIYFEDTGEGVSPEYMDMLFERLFREDKSRNRKTGGSGLGLAISKKIIELHGGTISSEKSDKGGLSINIVLPIKNKL